MIGGGPNAGFYGSFQNRPFIPPSPVDPVLPVTPPVDPVLPVTPVNPVLAVNPPSNQSPIASNPNNSSDSSNSNDSPARPDKISTDQDLKAQTNNSNTLNASANVGAILKVNLIGSTETCHATGMRINQDGTIELTGSCVPKENQQPQKNVINPYNSVLKRGEN